MKKIQALKSNARSERRGCQEAHAVMEEKLYNESLAMRHQEKPVKRWRFLKRGKQILDELEPDNNSLFLNQWFEKFQNRYEISLRRKTHCFPQPSTALEPGIKNFKKSDLVYMDQTP